MRWEPKWGPFPWGGHVAIDEVQRRVGVGGGYSYRYVPRQPQRPIGTEAEVWKVIATVVCAAGILSMVLAVIIVH